MLTEKHFYSFAFPWLIFDSKGSLVARDDGCLFPMPEKAKSIVSEKYYVRAPLGWSKCPMGFAVYVVQLPKLFDYRLVIPGLKVKGISTAQGASDGLSVKTSRQALEKFVLRSVDGFDQAEIFFRSLMERNVHEMRQINRDIIAANEDVAHFLTTAPNASDALIRVNNLRALSEILGSRTDFLDYLSGSGSTSATRVRIRPFQKFDKTVRSLRKRAHDRSVSMAHWGTSVGYIEGLPVFEIIPYLLIENAIKFAPRDSAINVTFEESETWIKIVVQNVGPVISEEEIRRVFESGFRGENAIKKNISGSGVGLFFLRDLVERHHSGTLKFSQIGEVQLIAGIEYRTTEITLGFKRIISV